CPTGSWSWRPRSPSSASTRSGWRRTSATSLRESRRDRTDPRLAAATDAGDALALRTGHRVDDDRPRQPLRTRRRAAYRLLAVPHRQHDRHLVHADDRHHADLERGVAGP